MRELSVVTGLVVVEVRGPDRRLKARRLVKNLITDAGDQYHCVRIASAVVPAAPADATKMTGMKLGTGTTAAAKNGAGAALVTYLAGTNKAFDATYPNTQSLGAGLGWTVTYQSTWGPGVGTNAALTEVVMVNDSGTDATSTAANTAARSVFSATPKGAADTLTISWAHKQLGA